MTLTAVLMIGAIGVGLGVIAWEAIETQFRAVAVPGNT